MMNGYGYGNYSGVGRAFGLLTGCCWLLFLIAGVVLVIWLVRRSPSQVSPPAGTMPPPPAGTVMPPEPRRDEACDIARRRYASGEITAEEYRQICETLGVRPDGQ